MGLADGREGYRELNFVFDKVLHSATRSELCTPGKELSREVVGTWGVLVSARQITPRSDMQATERQLPTAHPLRTACASSTAPHTVCTPCHCEPPRVFSTAV
eukprot:scaffold26529_cov66-Phaeocystis_antarctica.AAC.2